MSNLSNTPQRLLHVNGRGRIASIPLETSVASVCFNGVGDILQCGASSLKLKTNVRPFNSGLDVVRRLSPISYNWREGGDWDFGLGAEHVARIAPQLTLTDAEGNPAGVKYEKLSLLLINAVKEQQIQIERLKGELRALKTKAAGSSRSGRRRHLR